MASLDLNGIAKSYDGQRAVDGIDLHIPDGALACLLGPSGCGKTTTLRLIAGFMSPDAGEIRVGGEVLSSPARTTPPEARRMSMVFQSYALWPHMTVARNVAYGLERYPRRCDRYASDRNLSPVDRLSFQHVACADEAGNELRHRPLIHLLR